MSKRINLATYYLLPLIELSKSSFGDAGEMNVRTGELTITEKSNFINCYLSTENYIVVMVRDFSKIPRESIANHNYFSDIEVVDKVEGKVILVLYRVDKPYLSDVLSFREGKYSRMREIAKDKIVMFNNWDDEVNKRDNPLYGTLYRDPKLREQLENLYDIRISKEDEVKSLPREENFIDLSKSFEEVSIIQAI